MAKLTLAVLALAFSVSLNAGLLHEAVESGKRSRVVACLRSGAEVNEPDEQGRRPLDIALGGTDPDILELLTLHGAQMSEQVIVRPRFWRVRNFVQRLGRVLRQRQLHYAEMPESPPSLFNTLPSDLLFYFLTHFLDPVDRYTLQLTNKYLRSRVVSAREKVGLQDSVPIVEKFALGRLDTLFPEITTARFSYLKDLLYLQRRAGYFDTEKLTIDVFNPLSLKHFGQSDFESLTEHPQGAALSCVVGTLQVSIVDFAGREIKKIAVKFPFTAKCAGRYCYISTMGIDPPPGAVLVYESDGFELVATIPNIPEPRILLVARDDIVVACGTHHPDDDNLLFIDRKTHKVASKIRVANDPRFALSQGDFLFVHAGNFIFIIRTSTQAVIARRECGYLAAMHIAGSYLFLFKPKSSTVEVYDVSGWVHSI